MRLGCLVQALEVGRSLLTGGRAGGAEERILNGGCPENEKPGSLGFDGERVPDTSAQMNERAGWCRNRFVVAEEGELAVEHVERFVVTVVHVHRRAGISRGIALDYAYRAVGVAAAQLDGVGKPDQPRHLAISCVPRERPRLTVHSLLLCSLPARTAGCREAVCGAIPQVGDLRYPDAALILVGVGLRAAEVIIEACEQAGDVHGFIERARSALRRAVAFDASGFRVTDPETLLWTDAVVEAPAGSGWRFIENELLDEDFLKFATLARGPVAGTLHVATGGELARSRRYRTILAGLGLGDELRAALIADGVCWGTLCLSRGPDAGPFTTDEVRLVKLVAPRLAQTLRVRLLASEPASPLAAAPGTVLVRPDDTIAGITAPADQWLREIGGGTQDGLPAAARAVAIQARATAAGISSRPASARARGRDGTWFELHAAALLDDPSSIIITIAPAPAGRIAPLLLASFELSGREREVLALLLRGLSTESIARHLVISRHTVRDHTKAIFAKAGVNSRPELVARVLATIQ